MIQGQLADRLALPNTAAERSRRSREARGLSIEPKPAPNTNWMAEGSCRGVAGADGLFFPERGESTRDAKAVCADCPVKAECLEYALANSEKFGIWGGTSERERRRLRNDRRRGVAA